jgi:hypothetical protein
MRPRRIKIYVVPVGSKAVERWSALIKHDEILEVRSLGFYEVSDTDCSCPGYAIRRECKHSKMFLGIHPFTSESRGFTYARILHTIFEIDGVRTTVISGSEVSATLRGFQSFAISVAHPGYPSGADVFFEMSGSPSVRITLRPPLS